MASDSHGFPSARGASLFERRMLAIGIGCAVVVGAMAARLFSLTVISGGEQRALAESRLDRSALLPTVRGSILDRKGRVLAESVPSYDLALFYPAIAGTWADGRAVDLARREAGRAAWNRMGPDERGERIERHRRALAAELDSTLAEACAIAGRTGTELATAMGDVRTQVERKANAVWESRLELERARYGEAAEDRFEARPIAEQSEAHVVFTRLPAKAAFALRKLADAHPGILEVQDSTRRVYPMSVARIQLDRGWMPTPLRGGTLDLELAGVADHIVGDVRDEVWRADLDRRPFRRVDGGGEVVTDLGGYRPGRDMVGARGLERTYEDFLRGTRGRAVQHLDTGDSQRTEPVRGGDLHLSLDVMLQARVQALFDPKVGLSVAQQWHVGWNQDGTPKPMPLGYHAELNGAAVVIDIDTGEVLSMVSWPTVAAGEALEQRERAQRLPDVNRALEAPYPPGSLVKPLVYVAAVRSGAVPRDVSIECNGHYFGAAEAFGRCWIYRSQNQFLTHTKQLKALGGDGALAVEDAIARSCNIFFYTLADRMGLPTLSEWYRNFGLGTRIDVGLARLEPEFDDAGAAKGARWVGEHPGSVPGEAAIAALARKGDRIAPVIAGIGQGPVLWTPLQAANAYATLARGGVIRDATLLRTDVPGRPERRTGDLRLDPVSCDRALEGLRQAVSERVGTGHHVSYADRTQEPIINVPGVTVWAKTGTAQAPVIRMDDDGDGTPDRTVKGLEHGWFVGLAGDAGENRPRYAIAVLLENGGSGGKSAGPIANQVIHALVAEGYLAGDPRMRSRPKVQPMGDPASDLAEAEG
ncbi:MAG: penicillin-binding transpeptidase domain-containing protein [Phycisphaerales bacterium]|jgi:penicillin-binding protein 2